MGLDPRIPVSSAPPPLAQRLRSPICSSCCFGGGGDDHEDERPASLVRSSAAWLRRKAQGLPLPEVGGRCRSLAARIGRHRHRHRNHHARASGDFVYDPLSYALNFDEGQEDDGADPGGGDEFRYRSFSSRLQPSPAVAAG